jgi:hypothetical protein
MSDISFEEQRRAYQMDGYAIDPSLPSDYKTRYINNPEIREKQEDEKPLERRKRISRNDPSDMSFMGPWAKYEDEIIVAPPAPTLVCISIGERF